MCGVRISVREREKEREMEMEMGFRQTQGGRVRERVKKGRDRQRERERQSQKDGFELWFGLSFGMQGSPGFHASWAPPQKNNQGWWPDDLVPHNCYGPHSRFQIPISSKLFPSSGMSCMTTLYLHHLSFPGFQNRTKLMVQQKMQNAEFHLWFQTPI